MPSPVLHKLESFTELPPEDRDAVLRVTRADKRVPARTDLVCEGDNTEVVHLITAGLACRYKRPDENRRQIVALLLPGDFCNLHTFIAKEMDHNIGTLAPSRVVQMPAERIRELLTRPTLAQAMLLSTLVDEATLREWITNVGARPAVERLAHLFCEVHARMRVVGLSHDGQFLLPMTQTDLAETVGLSLVHTNKSLKKLKDSGLIRLQKDAVHIPKLDELRAFCSFKPTYLHLGYDKAPVTSTGQATPSANAAGQA